jgi:hypothetical protein
MQIPVSEERPKAVTVIGWVWLSLAILFLFRSLLDLFIWKVLQPAAPSLFAAVQDQSPRMALLRPLFGHFTAVKTVEAIASVAVGVAAYQLLRLRAWARLAVQAVCGLGICYLASFAVLWAVVWTRMSAEPAAGSPSGAYSHRMIGLVAGLTICLALAAGLIVMITVLRSPAVRGAFARPPSNVEPR